MQGIKGVFQQTFFWKTAKWFKYLGFEVDEVIALEKR